MTKSRVDLLQTALQLRQEFDRSFAALPRAETETTENFLALRAGNDAYAIRIDEIAGLYADRRITPLPTMRPELLGVAGFRGQIAPVYNLAALLGQTNQAMPRWLILARLREPLALAFDLFESYFSVSSKHIVRPGNGTPGTERHRHLRDLVHIGDAILPIIQLRSLAEEIQRQVGLPKR